MNIPLLRKARRWLKANNVYQEFKPLLIIMQLTGFAPYTITGNKLKPSKLLIVHSLVISIILVYSLYECWATQDANHEKKSVSLILSHFLDLFAVVYIIFCLFKYIIKSETCMDIWIKMNEIDEKLMKINNEINYVKSKIHNIAITFIFLCLFGVFLIVLHYLQSINRAYLTFGFWIICFLPIFQSCVMECSFSCWALSLRRKCSLVNGALGKEIKDYEKRKEMEKCYAILNEERRRTETFRLREKIRTLKEIHFKVYEIVKNLNSLLGTHFLYIFVIYFFSGTLNGYNIIRMYNSRDEKSWVNLATVWCWTSIQMAEILNIAFSATVVKNKVQHTMILVTKFLIQTEEEDANLMQELQSFSLQMQQCGVSFSAVGLFTVNSSILLQFGIAVISNAAFFVQIDKIRNLAG